MSEQQRYRIDIPAYKAWYEAQPEINGYAFYFEDSTVVTVQSFNGEWARGVNGDGFGVGEMPARFLIEVRS